MCKVGAQEPWHWQLITEYNYASPDANQAEISQVPLSNRQQLCGISINVNKFAVYDYL